MVPSFLVLLSCWAAAALAQSHDHGHGHGHGHDHGDYGQYPQGPSGYQFSSFSGPVSGAVREITVPHTHTPYKNPVQVPGHPPLPQHPQQFHGNSVDYVAKPDYSFAYGVEDPHTGNLQKHKESRDGQVVKGEYSVVEPDGSIRTVKYTADPKNGFQATVHNTAPGTAPIPPPPPPKQEHQDGRYHEDHHDGGHQHQQQQQQQQHHDGGHYHHHGGYQQPQQHGSFQPLGYQAHSGYQQGGQGGHRHY